MEVWVGGGSAQTHQLVREEGATLNLWNRSPAQIAQAAGEGPVTWAGPSPDDVPNFLTALQQAGATWAVFESPVNLSELVAWREAHAE
jgi:hypothetical protein